MEVNVSKGPWAFWLPSPLFSGPPRRSNKHLGPYKAL